MKSVCALSTIMSLVLFVSACSDNETITRSYICTISQSSRDCSSIPTLNKGQLSLFHDGQFRLKGQYSACFHEEAVSIQGQYKTSRFNNAISIELLAYQIQGLKSSEFPTTIAVITLDKSSLKGEINDIWASIRSPTPSNNRPVSGISCQSG